MAITKNWTYSSDGGYAAKQNQKEYVPKSVANKASLLLREQERQRLIEAAKRLDAQTRGAAAAESSGFGRANNRQTFSDVIAANRNTAAPRTVREIIDRPESTWRSGKFNGVIDPRAKNEFSGNVGAGNAAANPAPKTAEKPKEEKNPGVFLSDAQKTRYGLWSNMGKIAGGEVYDYLAPVKDWVKENKDKEYKPTPREEFLYNRHNNMGEIAGGDFYDYFEKFKNPSLVDYTPTFKEKQRQEMSDGVFRRYVEGEKILNQEEFDSNFEANVVASVNRFSAMPAKTLATIMDMVADCIDSLSGEQKNEFCDWLRSMEDNSELLAKSERQYSQIDYDNEFINGLAVGVGKGLADMASSKFIGGIMHISPDLLSDIYSAGEIYNTAREKGYSVEQAMAESGLMFAVNRGANLVCDLLKDTASNNGMKSVLEILKNTTTTTAENAWLENNGEEGALSLEGIANTLAVEAAIQAIVKGAPYIGRKLSKSFLV